MKRSVVLTSAAAISSTAGLSVRRVPVRATLFMAVTSARGSEWTAEIGLGERDGAVAFIAWSAEVSASWVIGAVVARAVTSAWSLEAAAEDWVAGMAE